MELVFVGVVVVVVLPLMVLVEVVLSFHWVEVGVEQTLKVVLLVVEEVQDLLAGLLLMEAQEVLLMVVGAVELKKEFISKAIKTWVRSS